MELEKKYTDREYIANELIENGFLIHCTNNKFSGDFDASYIHGSERGREGYGFYFSDRAYKPIQYGDYWKIIPKSEFEFIELTEPIDLDFLFNYNRLKEIEEKIYSIRAQLEIVRNVREWDLLYDREHELMEKKDNLTDYRYSMLKDAILLCIKDYNPKNYGQLCHYIMNPRYFLPQLSKLLVEKGFDGWEYEGTYTIFNFEKLNQYVEDFDWRKYYKDYTITNESKNNKKVRQDVIPYESDKFQIGFEGNSSNGYAHICTEDIDVKSFAVKDELNPNLWKDDKLDSRIRLKLLDIADDFTDFLNVDWVKPEDITMTGSLANYNWSEDYSDIDLHIIYDFKKVDKRTEFVSEYFQSKKDLWNQKHENIKIFGFPVEVYVQDKNEPHASSGIYSLEKNKWVIKPEKQSVDKKELKQAEKKAETWANKIDALLTRYHPDKTESEKEKILNDLDDVFSDIKNSRRGGFKKGGNEMNKDNLTFKMLRRGGYLDKISNKKTEVYDDLMSINESETIGSGKKMYHQVGQFNDIFKATKSVLQNGLIPSDKNGDAYGVFFAMNKFYGKLQVPCFSLLDTEENFKKYRFSPIFDGDTRIATKTISPDDLIVENIPFASCNDNNVILMTEDVDFFKKVAKLCKCNSIAEYLAKNKNFENIIIYTDLFDEYVEKGTSYIFDEYPHIETRTLF